MSHDFQIQNLNLLTKPRSFGGVDKIKRSLQPVSADKWNATLKLFRFCFPVLSVAIFSTPVSGQSPSPSQMPMPRSAVTTTQKKKTPAKPAQSAPYPGTGSPSNNTAPSTGSPTVQEDESDVENDIEQESDLKAEAEENVELPAGDERVSALEDGDEPTSNEDTSSLAESQAEKANEEEKDAEKTAEKPVEPINPPTKPKKPQQQAMAVDEEEAVQSKIIRKKMRDEQIANEDRVKDRFPKTQPLFKLPPGPTQGGTAKIPHPRAKNGLVSISSDGIYQYKTKVKDRTQSGSFKVGMMSPPAIDSGRADITYESMYGNSNVTAFRFDYEWEPFSSARNIGIRAGSGIAVANGAGFFKTTNASRAQTRAEEKYTMYVVPLSAFGSYRFEYSKKQWLVPYILAGAEGYALAEIRSDNKGNNFAFSAAAGGGGGVLLPISRLDAHQAFTLSEEYGVSDMWLAVEGMYLQGLNSDIDFSNSQLNLGIQIDF